MIIVYSALLVSDVGQPTVAAKETTEEKSVEPEDDLERLDLIKEAQRTFEQHRRNYGDSFSVDSDSDHDDAKKDSHSPTSSDSDAPTSTDSDSPYGSDSESSSSYDEYHAVRQIHKKKAHSHRKGPLTSYVQERIGNWPKYRYKKYKRHHMKKLGIPINYGNTHTKEIKRWLKAEKRERKKEESQAPHVALMMEDVAKQTTFLSLDPQNPIVPVEYDRVSMSSRSSIHLDTEHRKSKSAMRKIKDTLKHPFKRHRKSSANPNTDDEQSAVVGDATSHTSTGAELHNSDYSLDKVAYHPSR